MSLNVLIVSNSQHHIAAGLTEMIARQNHHHPKHVHCEQSAIDALAGTHYEVVLVDEDLETQDTKDDAMAVETARKLRTASPHSFVYVLKRDIEFPEKGPKGINGYLPKNMHTIDKIFSSVGE